MTPAATTVTGPDARTPPKWVSFTVLFLIEMWERFGYYGMTAVVVLYMVQKLGYTDDRANLTFGAFVAHGLRRAGGGRMDRRQGAGQPPDDRASARSSWRSATCCWPPRTCRSSSRWAWSRWATASSRPTRRTWSRRSTRADPAKIDSAFTLYYMAVNVGATLSQIATPLIAERVGWHAAFAVCAGGMLLLGILNYFFMTPLPGPRGLATGLRAVPLEEVPPRRSSGCVAAVAFVTVVVQNLARRPGDGVAGQPS